MFGCSNKRQQNTFSYEEAIKDLQMEIEKMQDGAMKNSLLWQTERIINRDSSYKHKLGPNTYDSLMNSIVWNEYHKYLYQQMELRDLSKLSINDRIEAYKFRYHRSFSDEVVIITISNQGNKNIYLKTQVYYQDKNCNPIVGNKKINGSCFEIKVNESKRIAENDWVKFKSLIEKLKFWSLKEDIRNKDDVLLDGSDWLIEGTQTINDTLNLKKQIYKQVYRWSPKKESSIYKLGTFLLEQNDYDFGEIY